MNENHSSRERELVVEIEKVWNAMKAEATKFSIGDMETGDEGPGVLRARLPFQFRDEPLSHIRSLFARLNKSGKAAKHRPSKRPWGDRVRETARNMQTDTEHSEEYDCYITSTEWKERASEHKRRCNYRCQVCGRDRLGRDLDVHHWHYDTLGNENPWDLLCCCGDGCHQVMHQMLRWGSKNAVQSDGDDALMAFVRSNCGV